MSKWILAVALAGLMGGCGGGGSAVQQSVAQPTEIKPARSNVVAFIGDSIIAFWQPYLPPTTNGAVIESFGVSGQQTAQILARFQSEIIDASPQVGVVVIEGGPNDLYTGNPVDTSNMAAMAAMAKAAGIKVIIASVMLSRYTVSQDVVIQPTHAIQVFDQDLITLCADNGYVYADFYDDMLLTDGTEDFSLYQADQIHPNAAGYAKMWALVEPLIQEELQ